MSTERLSKPPSRQRVVEGLAIVITAGAFLLALCIYSSLFSLINSALALKDILLIALFIALPATLAAFPAGWKCMVKPRSPKEATGVALSAGLFAGPAAVGMAAIILFLAALIHGPAQLGPMVEVVFTGLLATLVVGTLFGTPTGLFFSVPFIPLVRFGCSHGPSLDLRTRTERVVGLWFLLSGALSFLLSSVVFVRLNGSTTGFYLMFALELTAFIGGGVLLSVAGRRRRRQQQWLTDVAEGRVDGWSVVNVAESEIDEDLLELPSFYGKQDGAEVAAVLLHRERAQERGAYRTGYQMTPVARLASSVRD